MEPEHERIEIAGAGPAGLAGAITLAGRGAGALVYEKRTDVGLRFHGDYQGLENWTTRKDVLEEFADFGIEPTFEHHPCRELVLFGPSGRPRVCRSAEPLFYLVRRGPQPGSLDQALKEQVLSRGIPIRFGETKRLEAGISATGPRGGQVIALGYLFDTDMADGVYAAVSEHLAPQGYSYLLVAKGRGTVASCLFDKFADRREYLDRTVDFFRHQAGLRMSRPQPFGGTGNLFHPGLPCLHGNVVLAGEQGGFQDPLFGFGIRQAVRSGRLAALALLEGSAHSYQRMCRNAFGPSAETGWANRDLYVRGGHFACHWLVHAVTRAPEPRAWLRRFYGPSLLKSLWFRAVGGPGLPAGH